MKLFYSLIICIILAFFYSCESKNNETAANNKRVNTFYYYPKTNVYYDIATTSYIYSVDSGKNWTVLRDSTGKNNQRLGKKVIINSSTNDIWRDNELHRKMYGGNLINLTGKDTSSVNNNLALKPKSNLKKKKLVISNDSLNQIQEPKKKRSFFQRLFGKKKRKKDPESTVI